MTDKLCLILLQALQRGHKEQTSLNRWIPDGLLHVYSVFLDMGLLCVFYQFQGFIYFYFSKLTLE